MNDEEYVEFLQTLSEIQTDTPIPLLLTEKPFCDKYIIINFLNFIVDLLHFYII